MTDDASARTNGSDPDPDRQAEREEMLDILDAGIEACLYKIPDPDRDRHQGRITDAKKEQARAKWINSLAKLLREKRMLLRDRDLEDLADRVDRLEADTDPQIEDLYR